MTKKEAIEALIYFKRQISEGSDIDKAIDMAIIALSDGWIPCSERLPETKSVDDWAKALVCSADGGRAVGSFNSEYGWTFSHWFGEPIAWMPLPEPYGAKESDR